MKKLTILIVNFNAGKHLEKCLESLYANKHITDFETIVADNNSSDDSMVKIETKYPQVTLIKNKKNLGFAKANNMAIRQSKSKYVLLLNSDTLVQPDSLDLMTVILDNSPETGVLSCQLQNRAGNLQESFNKTPGLVSEFLRKIVYNKYIENRDSFWGKYLYNIHQESKEVEWVSGSCMMLRREALESSGLFDENYFMYFEDVDLCLQMKKSGWAVRYTPIGHIVHIGGVSVATNPKKVNLEYRKSQLYFYKKYHRKSILSILKIYLFIKISIRIYRLKFKYQFKKMSSDNYRLERELCSDLLATLAIF